MTDTEPAGRKQWLGLVILVLPTLVVAVDLNALFLALPRLSADLGASGTQQLWITDIYGFMVAGLVITMGSLGDRIGRRRLLLIGGAAFAIASVVAAYSTSPEMLIGTRLLLGVAGATLAPSTLALISSLFHNDRQRGQAISIWATSMFAGAALGPVFGGFLLQHFWWGSVFLISVPVMALLLICGPILLPEHRNATTGRLDFVSAVLSLAAVLPLIYGLKQLTIEQSGGTAVPIITIVAGLVLGAIFVRRQLTLADPLLDLRLFKDRFFTAILIALVVAGISMAGTGLLVTQYLQGVLGYSPALSAVLFAPMGLGVALGTMTAPALARRVRPATAIACGLLLSVPGCLLLTQVHNTSGLPFAMAGVAILALGTGPLFALGTGLVIGSVPIDRAGSAASMSETGNYFGGALGLAVLGAVGAAVYRDQMAEAGASGTALETLAGASSVAQKLPAAEAHELLQTAGTAYTSGLHVVAIIAAVLFAGLSVHLALAGRAKAISAEPSVAVVS